MTRCCCWLWRLMCWTLRVKRSTPAAAKRPPEENKMPVSAGRCPIIHRGNTPPPREHTSSGETNTLPRPDPSFPSRSLFSTHFSHFLPLPVFRTRFWCRSARSCLDCRASSSSVRDGQKGEIISDSLERISVSHVKFWRKSATLIFLSVSRITWCQRPSRGRQQHSSEHGLSDGQNLSGLTGVWRSILICSKTSQRVSISVYIRRHTCRHDVSVISW